MSTMVMAAHGAGPRRAREAERWTPPMDADTLTRVLTTFRAWDAFDADAILESVGNVLGNQAPRDDEVEDLAMRLRGSLMQLVNIALAGCAHEADEQTAVLIERARTLRSEEMPGDRRKALGHLRRLGWVTSELLERLAETGYVKDVE